MSRLKLKDPMKKRKWKKGAMNARIVHAEIRSDGREWEYHVTKGWRSHRGAGGAFTLTRLTHGLAYGHDLV